MEIITQEEIAFAIQLKNHLLTFSPETLKQLYGTPENYLGFLVGINAIRNYDYGYFMLDNMIIDRIRMIIETRRDDPDNKEILDVINPIIVLCNHIDSLSDDEKNFLKTEYLAYQEDIRNVSISSIKQMLNLIINDALVYYAVFANDWSVVTNDSYLLASTLYLAEYVPNFFKVEEYRNLIKQKLDSMSKKKGLFRRANKTYIKVVSDVIDDINSEKEE